MSTVYARIPTPVWLNLEELNAVHAALTASKPQGKRPNREMGRLLTKIGRARERKRERVMRPAYR
jgi:hypothetical protein